jgi:hypothetical protein
MLESSPEGPGFNCSNEWPAIPPISRRNPAADLYFINAGDGPLRSFGRRIAHHAMQSTQLRRIAGSTDGDRGAKHSQDAIVGATGVDQDRRAMILETHRLVVGDRRRRLLRRNICSTAGPGRRSPGFDGAESAETTRKIEIGFAAIAAERLGVIKRSEARSNFAR